MRFSKKLHKIVLSALMAAIISIPVQPSLIIHAATTTTSPADGVSKSDIVVLYDNDVHCAVDGYANMAALKKDMKKKTSYVSVVSSGDFAQGATIGAISKGEDIIKIMNKVGYDAVTLGNHEFDYQIPQLKTLTKELKSKVVSSNFMDLKKNKPVYQTYTMKKYGKKKVAFVGITTPESITKSTPAYFQDKKGKYIYGFCSDSTGKALYKQVQNRVNAAKKAGADYVVALSHLGDTGVTDRWSSLSVIKNTTGIDVVLDGHSHSTIVEQLVKNKAEKKVELTSTGTKFANIGKLVITKKGKISTQLVSLKDYTRTDAAVKSYIESIKKSYQAEISKVVGKSNVNLTTLKSNSQDRAIRSSETNMGDFCADALRTVLGADVAIMNGGGIRADIKKGDVTYNDFLSVFPWSNMGCVYEVTGQQIKDALELGSMKYPEESGGFMQVSGITYEINSSIPSSVKLDNSLMFQSVDGPYRVQNIKVLNSTTNKYEDLDLTKKYKLAGINYTLKSAGDGFTMFKGDTILKDEVAVDNEILIDYLKNNLNGVVGDEYADPAGQGRIVIK